jgi:hypothetical protein
MASKISDTELSVGREPTDDIWESMYTQRAIRYWQQRPVPRELPATLSRGYSSSWTIG